MTLIKWALGAAAAATSLAAAGAGHAQTERKVPACDVAAIKAPADTTIVSAKAFTTPVEYCRFDGYVTTTNPGPNKVRFQIALPKTWNGRYFFTVQGGAAGFVPDPSAFHLQQGYAIASTDKGVRTSGLLDFSFRSDPGMSRDWNYRGMHVSSVATQAITRDYYKQPKIWRYVMGCSGGGHGSLTEAERYPQDFDGFLPGAQGYSPDLSIWWGALAQRINRNPKAWISPEDFKRIDEAVMAAYDEKDGAKDGLIWNPEIVKIERAMFPFLSDDQFGTLEMLRNGVHIGEANYPGYWMGNPSSLSRTVVGPTAPPWGPGQGPALFTVTATSAKGTRGPSFDALNDIDYTSPAEMTKEHQLAVKEASVSFDPKRLSALKAAGAKVMMWTGAADNAVPPETIVEYTNDVRKEFGPGSTGFFRSFFAPGAFHCTGGVNEPTDYQGKLLDAMVDWVEKGKAPESIVATNAPREASGQNGVPSSGAFTGKATRTYLICAYPKRSIFKGGEPTDAKNWRCEG